MTQSLNAKNVIVASSSVSGTVTRSQHASSIIVMSPPASPTMIHTGSIIVTSSPVAETVTQKVTTVLGIPTTSVSPLADYLVHLVQQTTPTAPKRSVSRARLLTSDESLALLEQKENTKMALLEKEKRKIERAEKKQKREEALQQRKK